MPYVDKNSRKLAQAIYRKRTPDQQREYQRRYAAKMRKAFPDVMRARGFRNKLRDSYGMTVMDYEFMLESQGGVCGICGDPEKSKINSRIKALAVDHDHATGKVRGLLCSACNLGLGKLKDSIAILELAQHYLQRARAS